MIRRYFLAVLNFLASWMARGTGAIGERVNRLDPFNSRDLVFSRVRRAYHSFGFMAAAGLVPVALAILPATAMPVYAMHSHAAATTTAVITSQLGLLGNVHGLVGAQAVKKAFRYGTVKRRIPIGTFPLTFGGKLPSVKIPQVGMASRVLVHINGSYTVATAALIVNNTDGFDSLLAQANLTLNNGSAQIVQVSGIGLNAVNRNISAALPIKQGSPAGTGNVSGIQLPLAVGASTFRYSAVMPINANQGDQFEFGLVNLQAEQVQLTVDLTLNPIAQIFTVPANCTVPLATATLSYEYYEIPDLTRYNMPPLMLVRTIEDGAQAIAATGNQPPYQVTRLGTMLSLHSCLILNQLYGNASTSVAESFLRFNKTDVVQDTLSNDQDVYEAELYGSVVDVSQAVTPSAATPHGSIRMLPQAVTMNFWSTSGGSADRNCGDFRDAIDTEEITTTEVIHNILVGTTLNAGKDFLVYTRRVVQRLTSV